MLESSSQKLRMAVVVLAVCTPLVAAVADRAGRLGRSSPGSSSTTFSIVQASNGFGQLLPHRIPIKGPDGLPTATVIEIRDLSDLIENVTLSNPVLPTTEWPTTTLLPNGDAGNHFVYAQLSQPISIDSVLEGAAAAAVNDNLTGALLVTAVNPLTGRTFQSQILGTSSAFTMTARLFGFMPMTPNLPPR